MDKSNLFIVLWKHNPQESVQIHMIFLSAGFKFRSQLSERTEYFSVCLR